MSRAYIDYICFDWPAKDAADAHTPSQRIHLFTPHSIVALRRYRAGLWRLNDLRGRNI